MSDLIDRQAAIEALKRAEALARAFGYHVVIETVRELPSAQLGTNLAEVGMDVPDTNVGDMISRQAAINAVNTALFPKINTAKDAEKALRDLPSAQPRPRGEWLPDNRTYYEERFVCSVCERSYEVDTCMGEPTWDFCPGCGADMRL